ncbi:MAG TPA: hypothetical protein VK899_03670 [Gemmatimonadales bacterium]|nr:hypothetical protein [Gemmatimonadales bacterium]
MARNAFALALLTALALGGCSTIKGALNGDKEEKAAQAKLVALRARTDSLRKARRIADSLAVVRHAACVDSVRADLSKPVAVKKTTKAKRKKAPAPSPELIATQAQQVCEQMEGAPQGTLAANQPEPAVSSDTAKQQPKADSVKGMHPAAPVPTASAAPAHETAQPAPAAAAQPSAAMPTVDSSMANVAQDSAQKAKDLELSRETFAYSGAARDPFNSLLNMAKNGPELADLQLVGIYQNLRAPSGSIAVFREKDGGKRHKLRAGDQVGRSRLVQIRERDVVFTIEDFGFERQETLSLRKQEDVAP